MANAVLSYAVKKLGDFLIQEAVFLCQIRGEFRWLEGELRLLQSYLKDAEQKQGSDDKIRTWISEIQDIAYDTEDTIDAFIFKVNNEQIHTSTCGRMNGSVRNCFCCICTYTNFYCMGKDIGDIKKRVLDISRQRDTFEIKNPDNAGNNGTRTSSENRRIINSYGDENDAVVGFEDVFQDLNAKLIDDKESRSVISISGMGGMGKTTIAKKLYHSNKRNFELHAWIYVSQKPKPTEDLLRELIKSFNKVLTNNELERVDWTQLSESEVDRMQLSDSVQYLGDLLKNSRYLVVIDDVWHRDVWESIRNPLPDNNKKSRVIITTRNEDVAELSERSTIVHKLRFLGDEESWLLFCTKAFGNNDGLCPGNLKTLGKEMTKKCGGLPLAIIVLGNFLWGKEFQEWEAVKEHIWREVKEKSINVISPILDLSYDDLPINIKSCFLYLGIFPEDAPIEVEQLVKLWVAEQFVPIHEQGRTPEEVSKGYFKELLKRNLVQTVEENWSMTSSCRVHGLLRYLAHTKARETNFFRVCDEIGSSAALSSTSCRRFAVYSGEQRKELLSRSHKKVRTLYFLNGQSSYYYEANKMIDISVVLSFKLLRVLKIEGVDLRDAERKSIFFKVVGEMIHLGYFGLKDTYIDELPDSIRNLKALQTLNIEPLDLSLPVKLPKDICELKELRHLEGHFSVDLSNLAELTNLQTLKVMIQNKATTRENSNFLATLKNRLTSKMQPSPVSDTIPIEPLFNCKQLIELKITGGGTIREVPIGIHENLKKLKYLELFLSKPEKDPISELEMLPSLFALHLSYHQDKTIRWTFTANGFPQLQFLKLGNASKMELSIDEGAMPYLQFLCLENGVKQTLFPEKLRSLPGEEAMNWKFNEY